MTISKTESERLIGVDVIRILAMLMIVGLHTILSFTLRVDFFATKTWFILEPFVAFSKTGVLLFFILSGYLVINKSRSIKNNWEIAKNRILIPLCFFTVIDLVYKYYKFSLLEKNSFLFWEGQLHNITNFPDSSLWFLAVLLFIYLLNPVWNFIFSKASSPIVAIYLTKLAFIFSIFVTIIKFPGLKQRDFFNIFTLWLGYLFFYFYGGLVRNGWITTNRIKINVLMIIVGLFAIMAGDYYTSFTKIHSLAFIWSGYFFEYLSIPIVILAIGLFNLLIGLNSDCLKNNNRGHRFTNIINLSARLSYGIYLIHPFVVSILNDILGFDFDKLTINVYLYNFLNFFLVLSISAIFSYFIIRIPRLRWVIGEHSFEVKKSSNIVNPSDSLRT